MEAAPRFTSQVAGGDHFLEQWRGTVFAVVETVVEGFENRQYGVQADQVRQCQRADRLVATQAHAGVDVLGTGQAFLKHQDRFVDHRHQNPVDHKAWTVTGGDRGFAGAALLAAESALRAGAGLVSLATRAEHVAPALTRRPELMCVPIASANQLRPLLGAAAVLVVGPGLGQAAWGRSLLSAAASSQQPQVWDADALHLLASGQVALPAGCVITPHPGEAARLLGCSAAAVQADRPAAALALAQRYQARRLA